MLPFSANEGFLDGITRGFRANLVKSSEYANMTQCETLEDLKLCLSGTDYVKFMQETSFNFNSDYIKDICKEKVMSEFMYLKQNANETLAKFLEYLRYPYMIDNVVMVLTVLVHQRPSQAPLKDAFEGLLEKCHPLGKFENIGMLQLIDGTDALYNYVVADSPLAPYFMECLQMSDLDEVNVAIIRELLYKAYLDDFYRYCNSLGGATAEIMGQILTLEADRRAISISMFSLSSALQPVDKLKLFSNFGRLQSRYEELAKCTSSSVVIDIFKSVYSEMVGSPSICDEYDLEAEFMKYSVKLNKESFLRPIHYGIFYSYFALLEQEARNLQFITECISLQMRKKINSYIPIFD